MRARAAIAAAALLAGGCATGAPVAAGTGSGATPGSAAVTFAPTTGPPPTFAPGAAKSTRSVTSATGPPTSAPAGERSWVQARIAALEVQVEAGDHGYDRALFGGGWVDLDGDGCDTRCEVLAQERRDDLPGLPAGGWVSFYEGYQTPDADELDVDHLVPLAEAWRSGARAWEGSRRIAFANDTEHADALVAVTLATNRSKGDRDPGRWQPPDPASWCWYVEAWVDTKLRWVLSADPGEVAALRNMATAQGC